MDATLGGNQGAAAFLTGGGPALAGIAGGGPALAIAARARALGFAAPAQLFQAALLDAPAKGGGLELALAFG